MRIGGSPRGVVSALEQLAEQQLASAGADGRPVEPALEHPRSRARVLREALRHAQHRGVADPIVVRLARELDSANRPPQSPTRSLGDHDRLAGDHVSPPTSREGAHQVCG